MLDKKVLDSDQVVVGFIHKTTNALILIYDLNLSFIRLIL